MSRNLTLNFGNLVTALEMCGVGDSVIFVHCDISKLGKVPGAQSIMDYLTFYFNAMWAVSNTVVVPAYFYEYGRKNEPFDVALSPVSRELGLFPKYVMRMPHSYRSINPLTSVCAVGERAFYVCEERTGSSLGVGSPFDLLYNLNAEMVFIGVDLSVMTFVHYVEYMVGVPHLYSRICHPPVYRDGIKVDIPITAQVRYLDKNVQPAPEKNTEMFEGAGIVNSKRIGNGIIRVVNCRRAFDYLKYRLQKNPFCLLRERPDL